MKNILILGATSAIAQETARIWAADGNSFFLVARDPEKLAAVKQDLTVRGANRVECISVDLNEMSKHDEIFDKAFTQLGHFDIALIAYGLLGQQNAGEQEFSNAQQVLLTNFVSPCSLLTRLANYFEPQRKGTIAVISSVAGDRGRASNYVYGSAKGGLSIFVEGLRNRLAAADVSVVLIKPGFTDTPMTAHLPKGALFTSAEKVALGIVDAIERNRATAYIPWFWRWIMLCIRIIPEPIFKRMKV